MVLISIIIPTYNYGNYLEQAIQSILDQNDPNLEIIIVDDGSTDHSPHIVTEFINKTTTKIKYHMQKNSGPAVARNTGVHLASGEYLLFLDADDRLLPQALRHFRDFVESHPKVDMICAGHMTVEKNGKIKSQPFVQTLSQNKMRNFRGYMRKEFSLVNGGTLFHRRVFDKLAYPPLRTSEDVVLFSQTLAIFNCAAIVDPVVAVYKHDDSLRHHLEYNKAVSLVVIDYIFNPTLLLSEFFKFKNEYFAWRCLSLFRVFYLQGRYAEARMIYHQALKAYPCCLLKFAYFKKYLRILLK